MLKSPEPKLGQNAEELDAGWEEPAAAPPAPPRPSGVSVTPVAVATDELDDAWGDLPAEPLLSLRRAEPATAKPRSTVAAAERPAAARPAPATVQPSVARAVVPAVPVKPSEPAKPSVSTPRVLSKKERRALERKQRAHATRKGSERKQNARAKRREEAQRLAEQRQAERRAVQAAAKERARDEQRAERRATPKPRAKSAAAEQRAERAVAKSGTKRDAAATPRTKGRPKKYSGGGYIVALIALITLATGLYAWSKR